MENETIETDQANIDETIEEKVETSEPEDADNSNVETDEDPTSSEGEDENDDEIEDASENENFLGNFKTKEEADKGFKSLQAKLTEQANKIKELETAAQKNTENLLSTENVERKVADVKRAVMAEYNQRLQGLGYKYGSYIPNDAVIKSEDDIISYLPSDQAARFTAELMSLQANYNERLKTQTTQVYAEVNKAYEEAKAKDQERYKDNEVVFNAWYNPPETIEQVAELVENVKKQAIENYIKEQAAKKEDIEHKSKLDTSSTAKAKFKNDHVFTRSEIDKMTDKEFAKYERIISKQVAAGLIVE